MSEFVELQSFIKNKKFLNLGINGYFWITWILLGQHLKKLLPYLKSGSSNLSKFRVPCIKKPLGFRPKMPIWVLLGENLKKLPSYLKLALSSLSNF